MTAFALGVNSLQRRKRFEENSPEGVSVSEFCRWLDLGDLVVVKVNRRLTLLLLVSVFSALVASSGLSVNSGKTVCIECVTMTLRMWF